MALSLPMSLPTNSAACVVPVLSLSKHCIPFCTSSTLAELAALHLAANLLLEGFTLSSAAILSDSKTALTLLRKFDNQLPVAVALASKLRAVEAGGTSLSSYWIHSHVVISGNELADELAGRVHSDDCAPTSNAVTRFDAARHIIYHSLIPEHPDSPATAGNPPRPVCFHDFHPNDFSTLLCIRIGCV